MRHGERADDNPNEKEFCDAIDPRCDPSLTLRGYQKAQSHQYMSEFMKAAREITSSDQKMKIHLFVSPFLRTLQTAAAMICSLHNSAETDVTRLVVDASLCEVFGPSVIKNCASPNGPTLHGEPWEVLGVKQDMCDVIGSLPSFSETYEVAYSRILGRLNELMELEEHADCDVVLVITHGDALNAVIGHFHPQCLVYNCEYLGSAFVVHQQVDDGKGRNKRSWVVERAIGVEWIEG